MRLLIDECLSPRLALWLNETGEHDAVHPLHVGRRGLSDHRVLAWCLDEDRVIVTENGRDFRRLVAATDLHPGLIVLPSLTREATWRLLRLGLGLGLGLGLEHLAALGEPADVMVNRVREIDPEGRCALHALPPTEGG